MYYGEEYELEILDGIECGTKQLENLGTDQLRITVILLTRWSGQILLTFRDPASGPLRSKGDDVHLSPKGLRDLAKEISETCGQMVFETAGSGTAV
jgi:hypothetical protein